MKNLGALSAPAAGAGKNAAPREVARSSPARGDSRRHGTNMADMDGDYEGGDGCARGPQLSRRLATASRPDPITAPHSSLATLDVP